LTVQAELRASCQRLDAKPAAANQRAEATQEEQPDVGGVHFENGRIGIQLIYFTIFTFNLLFK
jgi:hypothetical protein